MKKENNFIFGSYFCGNKISDYGRKHGRVDYATLAKSFDAVLANNIISDTCEIGYWEPENGFIDNSEEIEELEEEQNDNEIFQYFIISAQGAQILEDYTNEIVFYNDRLDLYVWGVTHWGTSWDYVLTGIPCEKDETINA